MRAALHRSAPGRPALGVFESVSEADEMPGFPGVPALPWVHRGRASAVASRVLLRAVADLDLPAGPGAAYVAGESETCRLLQRVLIEQRGFSRRAVHTQPQWQPGRPGFGAGTD
ncbi:SIP domain-containing protein [Dactylosporangium sp. NPDC000244]|uniref:SIP domain-containing protein n=1 Tax=Dactylosporangium sp. NPDC000244 TaxID=3154365 RepID=UPI00332C0C35